MSLFPNFGIYHADFKVKVFKNEENFEYEHFDKTRLYHVSFKFFYLFFKQMILNVFSLIILILHIFYRFIANK